MASKIRFKNRKLGKNVHRQIKRSSPSRYRSRSRKKR